MFATLRINERQNLVLDLNQRNRHSPSLAAANGFELQLVRVVVDQMGLGEVVYLTKEEGETAVRTVEQQSNRAWNLWKDQATQRRREP